MSAPSSRASQASLLLQYVDSLLSQKGVPYQENVKPTIRSHLSSLLHAFPCLHVKIEPFSPSDGRPSSLLLLQIGGTIPVLFLQVLYNIPIVIWLSELYPFCAPLVFVTPSPFMIIKAAHPFVDCAGLVSCTRLYNWAYPVSNLVGLIRSLCIAFGQDPPLYSINPPSHGPDGHTSLASSSPSSSSSSSLPSSSAAAISTSVLSVSASSLLGPGSLAQPHPLQVTGARVPMTHSTSPPSSSTSLLGPGSLSQRWRSHGHSTPPPMHPSSSERRPSLHQDLSYGQGASMAHQLPSATSLSSAGLFPLCPSSQQHPVHLHDARASITQSSSSTSTTASLLGPGKISEWHSMPVGGRQMLHPPAALQSSGLSKRPSLLPQVAPLAHDVSIPPLKSSSPSLLGPGKFDPLHDVRNPSASSESSSGLGLSMQGHSSHSTSLISTPSTSSSSASLLGTGTWHPSYAHVGVSVFHPQPMPGSMDSTLHVPRAQMQQHTVINHINGGDLSFNKALSHVSNTGSNPPVSTMVLNSCSLLPMSQCVGPVSSSSQYRAYLPSGFSNPLLGMKDQTPDDRRQMFMDKLIGRLQGDIGEIRTVKEKDMLKLMDMEGLLKHRQAMRNKGIQELQNQKENLEVQLQNILINTDFLETWLLANEKKNVEIISIDNVFEPCDVLSYQLLECTALDLAIEDALYCLDHAAQQAIVPVEAYLRLVRTLSREQFFHRALAVKVRVAQGQC